MTLLPAWAAVSEKKAVSWHGSALPLAQSPHAPAMLPVGSLRPSAHAAAAG